MKRMSRLCCILFVRVTCVAALCMFLHTASGTSIYDSFSGAVPPGQLQSLYSAYFYNVKSMLPCTLTARVNALANNTGISTNLVGCNPLYDGNTLAQLVPLASAQAGLLPVAPTDATAPQLTAVFASSPGSYQGILWVLSDRSPAPLYNLSHIAACATVWNRMVEDGRVQGPSVVGLVASELTATLGGLSPAVSQSEGASHWTSRGYTDPALWSSFNLSIVLLPTNTSTGAALDFNRLVQQASVQLQRSEGERAFSLSPTANLVGPMQLSTVAVENVSCIDAGACMPLGGLNVVGTTADAAWAASSPTPGGFRKTTPPGSVAWVVRSSSLGWVHDAIPAADAAASGIVAALLAFSSVVEALSNQPTLPDRPQVYVFFVVGDEYDFIGSSRLVQETQSFQCKEFPNNNNTDGVDCVFPYYTWLNFTTIDLAQMSHFIQVEQVGFGPSSGLYYHVPPLTSPSANQVAAEVAWNASSVTVSSWTGELPPTASFAPFQSIIARSNASFSLLSRYDAQYENPHLFSPSDTEYTTSLVSTVSAASALARATARLLNVAQPDSLSVNETLAADLWSCFTHNFACPRFASVVGSLDANDGDVTHPNYYTSVFQFDGYVQAFQQLIFQQLSSMSAGDSAGANVSVFYTHAFGSALAYAEQGPSNFVFSNETLRNGGGVWVESNWNEVGLRIGFTDAGHSGATMLVVGIVLNAIVVAAVVMVFRQSR